MTVKNKKVSVTRAASVKLIPQVPSSMFLRPEISAEALKDRRFLTLLKCNNLDLMLSRIYNTKSISGDCIEGRSVVEHIANAPVRINMTTQRGGV